MDELRELLVRVRLRCDGAAAACRALGTVLQEQTVGGKWQVILREPDRAELERLRNAGHPRLRRSAAGPGRDVLPPCSRQGGGPVILPLAWKEVREHQSIWLTMVIMTVVMGYGVERIVALGDPASAIMSATLAILVMAASYGVVCGSMMLAGEHESGTLIFLDVFLGRRGLLWAGKCAIGALLVLTEALLVALALRLINQLPPLWGFGLIGQPRGPGMAEWDRLGPNIWFFVLPVVTLESFAWGMLGSVLTRRVLASALVAAVAPRWCGWSRSICRPRFSSRCGLAPPRWCWCFRRSPSSGKHRKWPWARAHAGGSGQSSRRFLRRFEAFERNGDSAAAVPDGLVARPDTAGQPPPLDDKNVDEAPRVRPWTDLLPADSPGEVRPGSVSSRRAVCAQR